MEKKKTLIAVRLEKELKNKIELRAKRLGISMSGYIRMIAKKDLEEHYE